MRTSEIALLNDFARLVLIVEPYNLKCNLNRVPTHYEKFNKLRQNAKSQNIFKS
jgi:hypothetical protein